MLSFVGSKNDSCIVQLDDLTKKRGDTVQVRFSPTDDTHDGFGESDTIRGNEQSITFDSDELKIGWLGEAFAQSSQMSQQRVNFDLKKAAFYKLSAWWARRWEESILNQLAGYLPASTGIYKRSGLNAVVEVDDNHHVWASGTTTYTDDQTQAGDTTAKMTLDLINDCVLKAMSKSHLSYPIPVASDGYYHIVMHPEQWLQLRRNTSSGEWQDIELSRIKGSEGYKSSGIAKGMLGIYNNVKLHVSDYTPWAFILPVTPKKATSAGPFSLVPRQPTWRMAKAMRVDSTWTGLSRLMTTAVGAFWQIPFSVSRPLFSRTALGLTNITDPLSSRPTRLTRR